MKRREFLKSSLAIVAVPVIPVLCTEAGPESVDDYSPEMVRDTPNRITEDDFSRPIPAPGSDWVMGGEEFADSIFSIEEPRTITINKTGTYKMQAHRIKESAWKEPRDLLVFSKKS